MNKIWFFGDSFIFGYLCHNGDSYFKKSKWELDKKTAPMIVADKLNMELVNEAQYGFSNDSILKVLINRLKDINKNDIVIIFDTHPVRQKFVDSELDYWKKWNTNSFIQTDNKKELINSWEIRHKHANDLQTWFTSIFTSLTTHLKKEGYFTLYFPTESFNFWDGFQRIREDEPSEDDGHLSFKGHKELSALILKQIEKNII